MSTEDSSEYETSDTADVDHKNHSQKRNTREDRSTQGVQRTQIPSLLTNSLRAVLATFGDDIVQLRARGSVETTNSTLVEDMRAYGLSWEQHDKQQLLLNYEQLPGAEPDEPINPLTDNACAELLEEVETRLGPTTTGVDPDLAVTSLLVRVTEPRLKEVTPAHTDEFDICFVSDPAEGAIREPTKRCNLKRGLYNDLGFEVRNLNVRTVVETATKHHQQSDGRYLSWGGPGDTRPRSPDRLAVRINKHVLPGEYGILKPYTVTEDNTLELAEDALTESDSPIPGDADSPTTETTEGDD